MFKKTLSLMAVVAAVAVSLPLAQAGGAGGGGPGGGGPGGGGPAGGGFGGGGPGGGGFGGGAGGGGFGGGGPGGFGGFTVDPAAQIQSSLTRIQTALQIPAGDEWTVLSSKIQKVLEDQQKLAVGAANPLQVTRGGAGGGGFGGGGPGGPGGGRGGVGGPPAAAPDPANPLAVARDDLSKALAAGPSTDTPTTADADLKTKMTAVRDNRKKLQEQLKNHQADLQKLVTIRQEAILLNLGVLE